MMPGVMEPQRPHSVTLRLPADPIPRAGHVPLVQMTPVKLQIQPDILSCS